MSKEYSNVRGHLVGLLDDPKEIERSFKRAVTDSGNDIAFSDDPAKAGVNNLLGIYSAVTGQSGSDVGELDRVLADGAEQARAISAPKLDEVKRRMGLVLPGGR